MRYAQLEITEDTVRVLLVIPAILIMADVIKFLRLLMLVVKKTENVKVSMHA
jgi:hypothetical protein